MRILHLINDLRVGGAETLVRDLAPAQAALGLDVSAAVLSHSGSFVEDELRASGIPILTGDAGIYSPRQVGFVRRASRGFDLVHVHLWPAQLWAALGVPRATPMVTTEQNTHNRRRDSPRLFRSPDALMYARFAQIIAVSDETARSLVEWAPGTKNKVTTIENALLIDRYAEAPPTPRSELGVPDGVPLIAILARLEPVKDIATLLDAVARVPDVFLAIAGDGPLRPSLEAKAKNLGIAGRVRFLGRIAGVAGLLKAADLYVQPSRHEGFPRAVAEAMAAGLPVVVSDAPGFADLVGDAAIRVPVGDPTALADAIRTVLADPGTFRAKFRRRVEKLDIDGSARRHEALYQAALASHKIQ